MRLARAAQELAGQAYVLTANADKGATRNPSVTFSVSRPAYVFVRDERYVRDEIS